MQCQVYVGKAGLQGYSQIMFCGIVCPLVDSPDHTIVGGVLNWHCCQAHARVHTLTLSSDTEELCTNFIYNEQRLYVCKFCLL